MRSDNALDQFLTELHRKPEPKIKEFPPPTFVNNFIEMMEAMHLEMGRLMTIRTKLPPASWRKL